MQSKGKPAARQADMDDGEEEELMPFEGIEKASVLQECREFSAVTIKTKKCAETIVRVLYLMSAGHTLSANEATDVFFGATKLFQSDNEKLRRLLFVLLKDLSTVAEQVFVASSSLVRDINSNKEMFRTNAIRTLRKVTDATMLGPMERFLRQAIVDKDNGVVSAALVTGIHLSRLQPDMVKRWGPEVSEVAKNRGNRAQYHALALLHQLRKNDRMSVLKLVKQAREGPIRSPLALCLIIKLCTELMQEDFAASTELYNWVNNMTHHSSDIVVFEAAKSLASIKGISAKEIQPTVLVLQLFLNSHRSVLRFSAVRLLNRIATYHPSVVASCHMELESMIHDSNRSIGTLAITTLLKSGGEFHIDRVLGVISNFIPELPEDGKMVIIDALKILAAKYPDKYPSLVNFLVEALSEEGTADLKLVVVETLVTLIKTNRNATELALFKLCEYIEDCEFNGIINRILTVVGEEGPTTSNPQRYIRYINNRIVLDKPAVRAVGVTTLAKFGAGCPALRSRIIGLLQRAMNDSDDDVRDRATFYVKVLKTNDEYVIRSLITNVADEVTKARKGFNQINASLRANADATDSADVAAIAAASASVADGTADKVTGALGAGAMSTDLQQLRDRLRKIPQLRDLGEPLRSTEPQFITEGDCEYLVAIVKHFYRERIVLQYKVTNTIEEVTLRNVVMQVDTAELEVTPLFAIPADAIKPGESQCVYVVLEIAEGSFPSGAVSQSCSFAMQEGDDEPGEPEEYPVDEFAINVSDYVTPLPLNDFDSVWATLDGEETSETYALESMKNLTEAQNAVIDFYGMDIVGGKPGAVTSRSHTLKLSGTVALEPPVTVLIQAKVFISADQKVALTLTLRAPNQELREFLCQALVS
jgi:coatomer protein complex subunit gamma